MTTLLLPALFLFQLPLTHPTGLLSILLHVSLTALCMSFIRFDINVSIYIYLVCAFSVMLVCLLQLWSYFPSFGHHFYL